jgi:hypothetical protein
MKRNLEEIEWGFVHWIYLGIEAGGMLFLNVVIDVCVHKRRGIC